ncbi:hypothetical protein AGMMS49921_01630 [Endomicrobiia bacterium]|nr:hypothetical protein AGMMS49921_01630 [Endomicrobiia bacterium]
MYLYCLVFSSTLGCGQSHYSEYTEEFVTDEWKNLSEKEKRRYERKEEEREIKKRARKREGDAG